MAAYREHISVSFALGVGVAGAAMVGLGFTPVQGILAGVLTGIGGMLPDLDSQSGRPVREIFGLTAALAPVVLVRRLEEWGGDSDGAMLLGVLLYLSIRYGSAMLLGMFSVHRGMFHSIPAMLIAGELVFLCYKTESIPLKKLMAVGICIGFASHLILDEIYAVEWRGVHVKLNKFAGSAVKFFGKTWVPNVVTYSLLALFTYALTIEEDILSRPLIPRAAAQAIVKPAPPLASAPLFENRGSRNEQSTPRHQLQHQPSESFEQQADRVERQDLRRR